MSTKINRINWKMVLSNPHLIFIFNYITLHVIYYFFILENITLNKKIISKIIFHKQNNKVFFDTDRDRALQTCAVGSERWSDVTVRRPLAVYSVRSIFEIVLLLNSNMSCLKIAVLSGLWHCVFFIWIKYASMYFIFCS